MRRMMMLAICLACAAGPLGAADILGQGSGLAMYKARRLAEVLPYDDARRVETARVMRRLGQLSLNPVFNREIGRFDTDLAPEWPQFALFDDDNDLKGDFFIYHGKDGPSDFYGAFFPLVPDGPPAWIVFPVGPSIADGEAFVFLFTHWADRNADGRIDLVIEEGVDMDGSGLPEAGASAWRLDDDFDGGFESALHCLDADCVPIPVEDGHFDLKLFMRRGDESLQEQGGPLEAADVLAVLLSDLRRATTGGTP